MAFTDIDIILTVQQTRWQKVMGLITQYPLIFILTFLIILGIVFIYVLVKKD